MPYVSLKSPRKIDKMVISDDVSVQVDSHPHHDDHPPPPDAEDHDEVRGASDPGEAVREGADRDAEAADGSSCRRLVEYGKTTI